MTKDEADNIRIEIQELLDNSMEMFGIPEIVECSNNLTQEEKEWAKKNLAAVIVITDPQLVPKHSEGWNCSICGGNCVLGAPL
jgi:hypothetical protein